MAYYVVHIEEVRNKITRVVIEFNPLLEKRKWERDLEFDGEHFTISEGTIFPA